MRQYGLLRHALIRSRRRAPAAAVGAALLAGLLGACDQGQPAGPPANPPAANEPTTSPAASAPGGNEPAAPAPASPVAVPADTTATGTTRAVSPNALGSLAPFIAAAAADDARIRAAAAALNKVATPTTLTFNRTTAATAAAAAKVHSDAALPAGLPDRQKSAALQVYSDLVARSAPFYYIAAGKDGTLPRTDPALEIVLIGLKKNSPIAARFPADMAALKRLAAGAVPVPRVTANSTAAAELALLINWVQLRNHGCGTTGGYASGYLPKIVWKRQAGTPHWFDGTIGADGAAAGIQFTAKFQHGAWQIELNAC
ncbi:MAG: hypothetical protein V7637_3662 [Mycobacteriales bacterium]|jgi:hypothetical protein